MSSLNFDPQLEESFDGNSPGNIDVSIFLAACSADMN